VIPIALHQLAAFRIGPNCAVLSASCSYAACSPVSRSCSRNFRIVARVADRFVLGRIVLIMASPPRIGTDRATSPHDRKKMTDANGMAVRVTSQNGAADRRGAKTRSCT
jgi:hypothetical protein